VRDWGHVRLFSPWRLNIDAAAATLLRQHGWQEPPPAAMPTGRELVDAYLDPLARIPAMAAVIRTRTRVQTITRQGLDKVVTRERVVGGGHSAANALLDLGRLAQEDPRLRLVWAARAKTLDRIFGGRTADKLPARGKLGSDLQALVAGGAVQLVLGFGAERIER